MEYKITLSPEQTTALDACDFTLQQIVDERLAPVIESLRQKKALDMYAAVQASPELKLSVEDAMNNLE